MTTKCCGTCEFWDHAAQENAISDCLYAAYPKCFEHDDKMPMAAEEGQDCPVHKERENMTEWKEYTGSDEQIAEMRDAKDGFIAKNVSSISNIMRIKLNQIFISGQKEPYLPELFGHSLESFLAFNNTTHYLICNPHPLAEMICQQARTGQPVWVRYTLEWDRRSDTVETDCTTTPDWNIPNAEYSFTPVEEEV